MKKGLRGVGEEVEKQVRRYLMEKGWKILATNFAWRMGEIDIVAMEGEVLVLVEVKARRSLKFGLPVEAVDQKKLEKIARTGDYFRKVCQKPLPEAMRIDVVGVEVRRGGGVKELVHLKDVTG